MGKNVNSSKFNFTYLITTYTICILATNRTFLKNLLYCINFICTKLAFPTGRDSATFRDKGTEIPSLSRDKGTTGQAQNLTTGRDGTGF